MERRIGQINAALKGDSDVDMEEEEKKSVELPNQLLVRQDSSYCLRLNKDNKSQYCRFEEMFKVQENNTPHFYARVSRHNKGIVKWELYQKKDDPRINSVMPMQVMYNRSNCDGQPVICVSGAVDYAFKSSHNDYLWKSEKKKVGVAECVLQARAAEKANDDGGGSARGVMQSVINGLMERDMGAQEVAALCNKLK